MPRLKNRILTLGFLLVLGLNLVALLPRPHATPLHPVGEEVVCVQAYRSEADVRSVPILDPVSGKPVDSGARVHVYLQKRYEDQLNRWVPKATAWSMATLALLYGIAAGLERLRSRRAPAPPQ